MQSIYAPGGYALLTTVLYEHFKDLYPNLYLNLCSFFKDIIVYCSKCVWRSWNKNYLLTYSLTGFCLSRKRPGTELWSYLITNKNRGFPLSICAKFDDLEGQRTLNGRNAYIRRRSKSHSLTCNVRLTLVLLTYLLIFCSKGKWKTKSEKLKL